ncbi:MAG: alpha/beta fold hydrolase, partial [Chloroflexi bacterium]
MAGRNVAGDGARRDHRDQGQEHPALRVGPGCHRFALPHPYASEPVIGTARRTRSSIQSEFIEIGSLRVHHMHGGRGTPVVFIHGLGSSSYMEWRYNLEATGAKHRVFAPDLPGYGRTEKPRVRYSIPYFARFVERYIEDRGLRSAAIVG